MVWPDIARRPAAVLLESSNVPAAVPLNSCYVAAARDSETALVIAATLNTTWSAAVTRALADEARGGYRRHNAHVMARLPLTPPGKSWRRIAAAATRAHTHDDVTIDDIDTLVADALKLPAGVRSVLRTLAGHPG